MLKQKLLGVKRALKRALKNTEYTECEYVKDDIDVYTRHIQRKAKLQCRIRQRYVKKLVASMDGLNVSSGNVNGTVE